VIRFEAAKLASELWELRFVQDLRRRVSRDGR
jgi:hypothetical protein